MSDRLVNPRQVGNATSYSAALAVSCLISYWLVTHVLSRVHSLSAVDDRLGGMWAVIATIFVYRERHRQSVGAALTRAAATLLSFMLCLIYLLIFPFYPLGLVMLIGIGTLLLVLIGRNDDIVTTGITTAVVIVVAALSPHNAWEQPILRLFDTAVGIAVGLAAPFIATRLAPARLHRHESRAGTNRTSTSSWEPSVPYAGTDRHA